MPTMIKIAGITVDQDDPCAVKTALEAVRLKMISGEQVEEMSLQSPVTRETVRFSPGKLSALDAEIQRLDQACRLTQGQCRRGRRFIFRY